VEQLKKHWRILLIITLIVVCAFVWYAVWNNSPKDYVTVAFLNVGQGDAIYIKSPTGNELLVDGGPNQKILSELRKVMPFYDRKIDMLMVTNPDADHYAGFIDVLKRFQISTVIESGVNKETVTYNSFQKYVDEEHAEKIVAKRGLVVELGGGAVLRIIYPDKDVTTEDPNTGSIIAELSYGESEVLLTGDAPNAVLEYAARLEGVEIESDILKVGHHGSRTSDSETFARAVNPTDAVISAGKNNRYGHPHKETTDVFSKLHIPVLGTYEKGTIIFKLKSDGTKVVETVQ